MCAVKVWQCPYRPLVPDIASRNRRKRRLPDESLELLHGRQSDLPSTETRRQHLLFLSFQQAVVGLGHCCSTSRMARPHQQSVGRDPGPGMYKEEPAPVADPVSISFQQQLSLPLFLPSSACLALSLYVTH